jgi:thiol-disulfide isomerase/thioredoxin
VVANFSASWCGPCRVIAPVYAEMSQTYPQLMFLTIDVDDLMVIKRMFLSGPFILTRYYDYYIRPTENE